MVALGGSKGAQPPERFIDFHITRHCLVRRADAQRYREAQTTKLQAVSSFFDLMDLKIGTAGSGLPLVGTAEDQKTDFSARGDLK